MRQDQTTTPVDRLDPTDPLDPAPRERRSAARTHGVGELLRRRPELAGVHRAADLAAEAVRWSA